MANAGLIEKLEGMLFSSPLTFHLAFVSLVTGSQQARMSGKYHFRGVSAQSRVGKSGLGAER